MVVNEDIFFFGNLYVAHQITKAQPAGRKLIVRVFKKSIIFFTLTLTFSFLFEEYFLTHKEKCNLIIRYYCTIFIIQIMQYLNQDMPQICN